MKGEYEKVYLIEQWSDEASGFIDYDTKHRIDFAKVIAEAHTDRGFHVRIIHEGKIIWERE